MQFNHHRNKFPPNNFNMLKGVVLGDAEGYGWEWLDQHQEVDIEVVVHTTFVQKR